MNSKLYKLSIKGVGQHRGFIRMETNPIVSEGFASLGYTLEEVPPLEDEDTDLRVWSIDTTTPPAFFSLLADYMPDASQVRVPHNSTVCVYLIGEFRVDMIFPGTPFNRMSPRFVEPAEIVAAAGRPGGLPTRIHKYRGPRSLEETICNRKVLTFYAYPDASKWRSFEPTTFMQTLIEMCDGGKT